MLRTRIVLGVSSALALLFLFSALTGAAAAREQGTTLISRAGDGGLPNGPAENPVISGDQRYAQIVAFESTASNLAPNDINGLRDVFVIKRGGSFGNNGDPWQPGDTTLVSNGPGGQPSNGESFAPSVSGDYRNRGSCVAFLSNADNLVGGDTNQKIDAFLVRSPGQAPERVSLPGGQQAPDHTTGVSVSGDCKKVAFTTGGKVYVRGGGKTRGLASNAASDPSFAEGDGTDLVFAGAGGVFLSQKASAKPKLVAAGGSDPAYHALKNDLVAYEKPAAGHMQVYFKRFSKAKARKRKSGEKVGNKKLKAKGKEVAASKTNGQLGNGDSTDPSVGNSGYYVTFQSTSSNLGTNANKARLDANNLPDAYLYTDTRKITLLQSVNDNDDPLPGGGTHPDMSYFANYVVFSSPAPVGAVGTPPAIFLHYNGGK